MIGFAFMTTSLPSNTSLDARASMVCAGSLLSNHLGGDGIQNFKLLRRIAHIATLEQTKSVIDQIQQIDPDRAIDLFCVAHPSDVLESIFRQSLATRLATPHIPAQWAKAALAYVPAKNILVGLKAPVYTSMSPRNDVQVLSALGRRAACRPHFAQLLELLDHLNIKDIPWRTNHDLCHMIVLGSMQEGTGHNAQLLFADLCKNAPADMLRYWTNAGNHIFRTGRPDVSRRAFNAWWRAAPSQGLKDAWLETLIPRIIHSGAPRTSSDRNNRWINFLLDNLNSAKGHQQLCDTLLSFTRFSSSPHPIDGVNNILIHCERRPDVLRSQSVILTFGVIERSMFG